MNNITVPNKKNSKNKKVDKWENIGLLTCSDILLIVLGLVLFLAKYFLSDFDNDLFLARDPKFYNCSKMRERYQ